ncbi:MAG TPA: GtrA family protein [Candidatus Saccharimonadales bacterium]|nr:GtrA family protein [Candidatus Saccharimonadales bacterium]
MWHKHKHVREEAGRFSFVGIIVTTFDFLLLNFLTLVLHMPLIGANLISATVSSILSFRLNKRLTFSGQRHGYARTIIRYVLIVGFSVYVIQDSVLYLVGHKFDYTTDVVLHAFENLGLLNLNDTVVNNNVAKVIAVWVASIWNFFMLRKYVFVPTGHRIKSEAKR